MSGCFSFCISVFTFAAAAIGKNDFTLSCNRDYKGVFETFRHLDVYFHNVDNVLCTESCPCYFSNQTALDEMKIIQTGVKISMDVVKGSVNFGQCDLKTRSEVMKEFAAEALDSIGKLNQGKFDTFWKRIEKKFDCVGWCQTSYDLSKPSPSKLQKYLFSDVNRGIVHNPGCMKRMIDWLPKMLNTFGSVLLLISIAQIVSIIFVMNLFCDCGIEDSDIHTERQEDNISTKGKKNKANNEDDNRASEMKI